MPRDAPWVLVADGEGPDEGQSRSALWTVRGLAAAGYRVAVTLSNPYALAAASRFAERLVPTPPATDAGFAHAVWEEAARHEYLTILPAGDPALLALGTKVEHLVDKSRLGDEVERVGLSAPQTRVFVSGEELMDAAATIEYPVLVKPAVGKPARRCTSVRDLAVFRHRHDAVLVQPYLDGPLRAVAGVMFEGRLAAVAHHRFDRTWPPDAGMACAGETVEADVELEERLVSLLDPYEGVFEVDLIGAHVLDVNPRVYASLDLSTHAGVNLVGVYCDLLRGRPLPLQRARAGVRYRWLEGEIRNAIERLRHREIGARQAIRQCTPGGAAARGGPGSLRDPGPSLPRLRYVARRGLRTPAT